MEFLQPNSNRDMASDGAAVQRGVPLRSPDQVHGRQGWPRGGAGQDCLLVHVSWNSQVPQPKSISNFARQQAVHQGIAAQD